MPIQVFIRASQYKFGAGVKHFVLTLARYVFCHLARLGQLNQKRW